jgi:hypothetical protein
MVQQRKANETQKGERAWKKHCSPFPELYGRILLLEVRAVPRFAKLKSNQSDSNRRQRNETRNNMEMNSKVQTSSDILLDGEAS